MLFRHLYNSIQIYFSELFDYKSDVLTAPPLGYASPHLHWIEICSSVYVLGKHLLNSQHTLDMLNSQTWTNTWISRHWSIGHTCTCTFAACVRLTINGEICTLTPAECYILLSFWVDKVHPSFASDPKCYFKTLYHTGCIIIFAHLTF